MTSKKEFLSPQYKWNIPVCAALSAGTDIYVAARQTDGVLSLTLDGLPLARSERSPQASFFYRCGDGEDPGANIKTESYHAATDRLFVNGRDLCKMPSDGTKGIPFPVSLLGGGENTVTVLIGGVFGHPLYDEQKPHGHEFQGGDKDDFLLSGIRLSLPDGTVKTPDFLITHKGRAVGETARAIERIEPYPFDDTTRFWVGDGYGGADTWCGHTDARLDIPYCVDFGFRYDAPAREALFALPEGLSEGTHELCLLDGETVVGRASVIFDRTAPSIETSLNSYQKVFEDTLLSVRFSDTLSGLKEQAVYLENRLIGTEETVSVPFAGLQNGLYAVTMSATDNARNTVCRTIYLEKTSAPPVPPCAEGVPLSCTFDRGVLTADTDAPPLPAPQVQDFPLCSVSASGIPFHRFSVALGGRTSGQITLLHEGGTLENERLRMQIRSPRTHRFETVATAVSGDTLCAVADIGAYAQDDRLEVRVLPDYVMPGSDTLIWSTDPQHYARFPDLYSTYAGIYEYAVSEYRAGRIAYLIQTGDVIDRIGSDTEWQVADTCHRILDDAAVPYGVVSGNHDTRDYPGADYRPFWKVFPTTRYNQTPWFRGDLQNNQSHFDLITIGNLDFLFLYIGYGVEANEDTLAWAAQTLAAYPHRNAILCTHQYLQTNLGAWSPTSRAKQIYEHLIAPFPNVKMILCGHDDGSLTFKKHIGDRVFYELLSDYQFVELEDRAFYGGNTHYIGAVPHCNGDGYIRKMQFGAGTVRSTTFSPITGGKNAFGDREEFTMDIHFEAPRRVLNTVRFSAMSSTGAPCVAQAGGEALTPPDAPALCALLERAAKTDLSPYEPSSAAACKEAEAAAEAALRSADEQAITAAFSLLSGRLDGLKQIAPPPKSEADHTLLHAVSCLSRDWLDGGGNPLGSPNASLTAQDTDDGLVLARSATTSVEWPSAHPRMLDCVLSPVGGRICLSLDLVSETNWSMLLAAEQDGHTAEFRLNYAIDHFRKKDADSFCGTYRDIYDVTAAFADAGFDLTRGITLKALHLYVLPGALTCKRLAFLTDKRPPLR